MIVIVADALDLTELREVRRAIDAADFVDGRETAGYRAKRVKHNLQIDKTAASASKAKEIILKGLKRNPDFRRIAIPRHIQAPIISRYKPSMQYGRHVDDALMGGAQKCRTDLSVTVFLNEPDEYDGGELLLQNAIGEEAVKLPAGAAVVYPSNTLHRVGEVTRGERLAGVTWVQSYVRDPARREVLHDLDLVCKRMAAKAPEDEETDLAFKTYSNLLRMWSDA